MSGAADGVGATGFAEGCSASSSSSLRVCGKKSATPVIGTALDVSSAPEALEANSACYRASALKEAHRAGGGEKQAALHVKRGTLLARDRIGALVDDDSEFLELSTLAGHELYPKTHCASGGLVVGMGRIAGTWAMIFANDATVTGGTLFPVTVKKQLRMMEVAYASRLPCVYLVDSGEQTYLFKRIYFQTSIMVGGFLLAGRMSVGVFPKSLPSGSTAARRTFPRWQTSL